MEPLNEGYFRCSSLDLRNLVSFCWMYGHIWTPRPLSQKLHGMIESFITLIRRAMSVLLMQNKRGMGVDSEGCGRKIFALRSKVYIKILGKWVAARTIAFSV